MCGSLSARLPAPRRKTFRSTSAWNTTRGHSVERENGPLNNLFRVIGLPTHVLVGRDGRIVWTREGGIADDADAFERDIKRALDGKQ